MKERKILTKLGIIFGIIDLLLILFGVIFLKPKNVLAEELQNDFFINSEIYLFNDINAINFENGYIDKELITIDDKNNNENWFGWYSNLGYNLIQRNFDDTNQYYCLAIPLNNMLSKYLQFAFRFSSGPDLALIIKYSDNTTTEFATSDYTETKQIYSPRAEDINKNVTYIAWEIYNPDYYLSFLPLTQEGYYQLGFEEGKSTGFDEGMQSGYNIGYQDGYNSGISSDNILYTTLLDFNQLILNGNFDPNVNYWVKTSNNVNLTYQENYGAIQVLDTQATNYTLGIRTPTIRINQNDKYYFKLTAKSETNNFTLRMDPNGLLENAYFNVTNNWQTFSGYYTGLISSQLTIWFYPYSPDELNTNEYFYLKNIQLFNLTKMYGAGNEPTIEQCEEIFNKDYYDYTQSTPVEIGFYNGYLDGENEGIQKGINIGETNQIDMGWIQQIFRAIQTFFNIQIFPRVTLGIIVGIPFIITLAWFVIKMFRGGGGGED